MFYMNSGRKLRLMGWLSKFFLHSSTTRSHLSEVRKGMVLHYLSIQMVGQDLGPLGVFYYRLALFGLNILWRIWLTSTHFNKLKTGLYILTPYVAVAGGCWQPDSCKIKHVLSGFEFLYLIYLPLKYKKELK